MAGITYNNQKMKPEDLITIGREVLKTVRGIQVKGEAPMERGAGGDRTFPVDKIAEDTILKGLEALGEPFTVITEEAGVLNIGGPGGKTVVIDPIDGSKNAVSGVPFFGASIAVASGDTIGDLEMGYVINLANADEFWAARGKGAFQNGVSVRCLPAVDFLSVAFEAQNPSSDIRRILPLLESARRTRCFGSIALALSYVAAGGLTTLVNPGKARSFDFAAGYVLVTEAGGIFTDLDGNGIGHVELGIKRGASLLASANNEAHEKALDALRKPQV
ncbi:MAG: hypothetical protein M0018_10970 [Nitrospiraceae bacterium]|nr:hypothetical protein [Nitrospiraceae bacterium]